MTDDSSTEAPPQDRERLRQEIEDALLVFRPDVQRRFRTEIGRDVNPVDALRGLRDADVPRLLKHRILVDGFVRTPVHARSRELSGAVDEILHVTLPTGRDFPGPRLNQLSRQLDEATASGGTRLQQNHWDAFVALTDDVYDFKVFEKTFQACNDDLRPYKCRPDGTPARSRLIVAEFWSDRLPVTYGQYVNPTQWPTLSVFWKSMKAFPGSPQACPGPEHGYNGDYAETVKIFNTTLKVPLQIGVRGRQNGSRVWVRFNIARNHYDSTVPVNVDTGTVSAEFVPGGPHPTRVRATKYLHWAHGQPDFTELACDFGWAELMMQMAQKAHADPVVLADTGTPSMAGATTSATSTPPPTVDAAVKKFVKDVSGEWTGGIAENTPNLEKMVGRFTGPTWNIRWVNDLLGMGKVAVDRSSKVADHVRTLTDSLQRIEAGKDDNG